MMIYPTIELQNGRCVSLHRGRIDEPQIWHVDPVAKAKSFAADGAEWMHITDLDWVVGGDGSAEIVEDIIRQAGIPVQVGGGFRSLDAIENWIDKGAGRIVVSSLAAQNPDVVKQAAKRFPDQIVVAVDVFQGQLMTNGWRDTAAITPADFMSAFDDDPLAAFIVTDIDASEVVLMLAPETNGEVAVKAWEADGVAPAVMVAAQPWVAVR